MTSTRSAGSASSAPSGSWSRWRTPTPPASKCRPASTSRPRPYTGEIDGETLIVSVSYCWASKGHGDPKLTTIKQISKVLKYLMATALYKLGDGSMPGIGDVKLLVFLDYMSLPQSSAGATFLDRQQFGLGLGGVNVLYAHSETLTLLCTESHLNHVDGPDARTAYDKSGWPVFEREVTALGTPPMWTFYLSTCVKWIEENFTNPSNEIAQSNQRASTGCGRRTRTRRRCRATRRSSRGW